MAELQPGDYTGKMAMKLKAQHTEELAERQKQIGMTDQGTVVQEVEGVWDAITGERLDISEEEARAHEYQPRVEEPEEVIEVGPEYVVMKVSAPVESMTYGVGTSFDFYPGKRYRVSRDLFQHLEARGLVRQ